MTQRDDGGPAFPVRGGLLKGPTGEWFDSTPGISVRDLFAFGAMMGIRAAGPINEEQEAIVAELSYAQADAMLAERAKP